MKDRSSTSFSDQKTLLTMGLPVYNEEKYIKEAIESLLAQTYEDFILIISDNASTDKTPQICKDYADKDERIVYIRHKKNKGSLFNFRYVLEQTDTPFFMWCSGNDIWHPSFVEKLLPVVEKENVILSYPESRTIREDGTIAEETYEDDYTTVDIDNPVDRYSYILRRIPRGNNCFYGIWLTQALKNCNLNLKTHAFDMIVTAQAAFEGRFKQVKEVLLWRRKTPIDHGLFKRLVAVQGKESAKNKNVSLIKASYILENIEVLFRKRYSLDMLTKLWLMLNIIYFKSLNLFIMPSLKTILKKVLPDKTYSELKSIWHKRK